MNRKWTLIIVLTGAMIAATTHAHGIWFAQRSGEIALIYGEGAEDGATVARLDKVKAIAAYDASGMPVSTKLITTDYLLLADMQANPAVLTGVLDNGFFTQGADNKWVAKSRSQVPSAKKSGHYMKYAVRLLGDLKAPLGPLQGQVLQITPVTAALPTQQGQSLKLRALFNGQPIAGVKVLTDFVNDPEAKPLLTAKDGTVTVKVRNQGLNVIFASHEISADVSEDADVIQYAATLSFTTSVKEE